MNEHSARMRPCPNNLKEKERASIYYLAGVAQLISALPFMLKVTSSILRGKERAVGFRDISFVN